MSPTAGGEDGSAGCLRSKNLAAFRCRYWTHRLMHVSVCIVSFRNPNDVVSCLGGLAKSSHGDFEVVICENGGRSAHQALADHIPTILPSGQPVISFPAQSNVGYAAGINLCMNRTPYADAWWILNPDTVPDVDALAHLTGRLASDDCAGVGCTLYGTSGRVESRGGRWNRWFARAVSIDRGASLDAPPSQSSGDRVSYLSGASMLVGRGFVERVGPMREDYFLYGEEVEWCLRAASLGVVLTVAPTAKVMHRQGTTTGSVPDLHNRSKISVYLDERNKLLITRDQFPKILPISALGCVVMLVLRFGRRGAWAQLGYALQGWWSGLNNQRGKPTWVDAA
jgi:N-acetylglucosaminyl-diphospho-decaprenol L-rhamnosyltransferase